MQFAGNAGRLRQLACAHKAIGIKHAHPVDQVVARLGPLQAGRGVSNVVGHGNRARRKNREIDAAFALNLQLRFFHALAKFIVADLQRLRGRLRRIRESIDLALSIRCQRLRRRRVMSVTIDNHSGLGLRKSIC